MKIYSKILVVMVLAFALAACEKNEVLPDYQLVGTSTATIADISVSNEEPLPGEEITVTLYYVNLEEDPVISVELLEQIGDGEFSTVTTINGTSVLTSAEVTQTYTYTVPDVEVGTSITLDMLLSSQTKEYPQRERVSIEVSEEEGEMEES
ncbi:hypothetical protein WJR50_09955 [Catalinimonas sp. 4WD22]|uniref:hypothetical protein n=1 Tax=Catalinimonas locisalis TaxID=3133978 RepID=UPI0031016788